MPQLVVWAKEPDHTEARGLLASLAVPRAPSIATTSSCRAFTSAASTVSRRSTRALKGRIAPGNEAAMY